MSNEQIEVIELIKIALLFLSLMTLIGIAYLINEQTEYLKSDEEIDNIGNKQKSWKIT